MKTCVALGVLLLSAGAGAQTVAECQRCIDMGSPCYKSGWAEPCYLGGGNAGTCQGNSATWCPTMGGTVPAPPPTASPAPTPSPPLPPGATANHDSRLIAYVGNWQACPTDAQMNAYTHVLVSFAVTYEWAPGQNQCDAQCDIGTPVPVCNNQPQPALVQKWRAAGKKVILSFGGAGMGGSWDGLNTCWEHCYGKEDHVVDQLVAISAAQGFDGVDVDYEYYYENGQRGSSFAKGAQAQTFLRDVTLKLRSRLPAGSEVTHAPMDIDMVPGTGYFNVIKDVAHAMDFIMPQYYNGITRPNTNGLYGQHGSEPSALTQFNTLVNDCFGGDATKVVFGFCINDCGGTGSNSNAQQAVAVMEDLKQEHACNGGAFFWVATHDTNGQWSQTVSTVVSSTRGCSGTTPVPTSATIEPVPPSTLVPTPQHTPQPDASTPQPDASTPQPAAPTTPAPTPEPAVPETPAPTNAPAGGCNGPVIQRYGGCKGAPACCAAGLVCHYRSQWYSQCDIPNGNTPPTTSQPAPSTPAPTPQPIPATNAPAPSTPAPTPQPVSETPVPTDTPSTSAPAPTPSPPTDTCGTRIEAWGGCLNNRDCCQAGLKCYKQNQWWARCLPQCNYAPECEIISN